MEKDSLNRSIEQFVKRGSDYLQIKFNNVLSKIQDNAKLLNQAIDSGDNAMAMSPWVSPRDLKEPLSVVAPNLIRFGDVETTDSLVKKMGIDIPLLLPTRVNAIMMDFGTASEKVPNIFQNIILRLLLSMRTDLVKVSIVDMDFGASFPIIPTINNKLFKREVICQSDGISRLLTQLAQEIKEVNTTLIGNNPDIDSYNLAASDMAQPYHYVFIDDFPNGFTSQAIDDLLRLINKGNALRAGIRIFINYSEKNPTPRDFDIEKINNSCFCINRNHEGQILFKNTNLKLPIHSVPKIEMEVTDKSIEYVNFINNIKPKSVNFSLDSWVDEMKKNGSIWKGSTMEGIKVPIGYISPKKKFEFYMANDKDADCNDFFALIAGHSGYGKTVFLHNIIINSALKYSPEELCFYLADFGEGVSFYMYRDLPHAKALMLSNNKEYALRMLEDVVLEAKRRSDCYKKAQKKYAQQIKDLTSYREVTGEIMPRILFIMDEFHYLFLSNDIVTLRAKEVLCNGIRQWRKFGISVILCTQSISGVNFGDADTQITYRFALNLSVIESKSVIRNEMATTLVRKGQTIMNNTADGRVDMNVEFQSAFSPKYLEYVKYLFQLYAQVYKKEHTPFICEDGIDIDIADYKELASVFIGKTAKVNHQSCDVFVGKPDLLRDTHTRIRYHRQQNSNTLIIGDDYKTLIFNVITQIVQIKNQSHVNSKFYFINCFNPGDEFYDVSDNIKALSNNFIVGYSQDTSTYLDEILTEIEHRKEVIKEDRMIEERIIITILNAQNSFDLKPHLGKYGRLEQSENVEKLVKILSEGSTLGIHCIIHGITFETLFKTNGILDQSKHLSMFENSILLKGADPTMYLLGSKIQAPNEEWQMIVLNKKIDGEPYEQCSAYSVFSSTEKNTISDSISKFFKKYQNAN